MCLSRKSSICQTVDEFKAIRFEDGGLLPTTLADGDVCEFELHKVELDTEVESDIADCIQYFE